MTGTRLDAIPFLISFAALVDIARVMSLCVVFFSSLACVYHSIREIRDSPGPDEVRLLYYGPIRDPAVVSIPS